MANQRLEKCQKEAEEVTILMKDNVEKVFEREGKLANLEVRAEELKIRAGDFQKTAQAVERKTRWEKYKWYLICAAVVLLVVIILIIILAVQFGGGGGGGGGGEEREATQNP